MKKSFIFLMFLLVVTAFSPKSVFAGEPIEGVDVKLGKNPGGIVFTGITGRDGRISCKLEKGAYQLELSFNQIDEILRKRDKEYAAKPANYIIELSQSMPNQSLTTKPINRGTREISIVSKESGNFTATLIYTKVR
ncbi:MAG: hypothetical protein NTZ69_16285 [Bacteroidia bacterium]|nr:hypothetical protein [Bacteroidia bacterium]